MAARHPTRLSSITVAVALLAAWHGGSSNAAAPSNGAMPGRAAASRASGHAATSAAPTVALMVAGRSAVLFGPATVAVAAATVTVAGRRCRVGSGTPLAALVAARRSGGPAFSLRDYARCSRSVRDAGGLFLYRIGGELNRGQDGWVYKVDQRVGTTGAGDVSGPLGDGRRLRGGQQLLWFYCRMQAGGCQRTLQVRAVQAKVAPGATLSVSVTAYDDRGRATPAAGVTVALGAASATTGRDGRATLTAPNATGRVAITASAPGLVAAFPLEEQVG